MHGSNYGYDAPYVLGTFAGTTAIAGISSVVFLWLGSGRTALVLALYFLFFLANTCSFWYTTRRGKFIEWGRILDRLKLRGVRRYLTWVVAGAQS